MDIQKKEKLDKQAKFVRIKGRLVTKGYSQQQGIDYIKTYAHVARLKVIHISISFSAYSNIKLYQMDVKYAVLNVFIKEDVYVEQLPSFEDSKHPNHVYKLNKALYGLKQAPKARYERLSIYVMD